MVCVCRYSNLISIHSLLKTHLVPSTSFQSRFVDKNMLTWKKKTILILFSELFSLRRFMLCGNEAVSRKSNFNKFNTKNEWTMRIPSKQNSVSEKQGSTSTLSCCETMRVVFLRCWMKIFHKHKRYNLANLRLF